MIGIRIMELISFTGEQGRKSGSIEGENTPMAVIGAVIYELEIKQVSVLKYCEN